MIKKEKQRKQNNKGITLIALVITIIVLLILAGVTIATLTGDNGVLTRANEARVETEIAEAKERAKIDISDWVAERLENGEDAELSDSIIKEILTGKDYVKGEPGTTSFISKNGEHEILYSDLYIQGNTEETVIEGVKIPEGFYYVGGSKTSGIVISDSINDKEKYKDETIVGTELEGNQYVWIAVDGILQEVEGDGGKTIQDAINGEIVLGRYVFDSSGNIDTNLSPTTLKADLKEHIDDIYIYTEASEGYGNAVAVDIDGFIDSVRNNGGYYIARFEASEGEDGKAESKYDKSVWAIQQTEASEACQNLYKSINSDLINSYVWDTTTLFIQKYSGDKDYSRQIGIQETLANTGKATDGTNYDVRCNVFDIAGNRSEWTTETSTLTNGPSAVRGGNYYNADAYNTNRYSHKLDYMIYTFRSILYF